MRRPLAPVVGLFILVACGGQAAPPTTEAATNTTTVATTVAATAATTVTPETTAEPSTTAAPVALDFPEFEVPFALGERLDWSVTDRIGDWALGLKASPTRFLVVTTAGPATIERWVDKVTTDEFVEAADVGEAAVGGLPARVFDLRLLPGAPEDCLRPCVELFASAPTPEENFGWVLFEGSPNRAWFVDVNGETVALFAEAREGEFDAWATEVNGVLAEIEWTG